MASKDQFHSLIKENIANISNIQAEQLALYAEILFIWNKRMNLVGNVTEESFVIKHLCDSVVISPFLGKGPILDFGTGAGLPGIPLAIMNPDIKFSLLDSRSRRIEFIRFASGKIGLSNVSCFAQRIQDHRPEKQYGQMVSRAVTSLKDMLELSKHCIEESGQILAMKGVYPEKEISDIQDKSINFEVKLLQVENMVEQRHLVIMDV